MRIAGCERLINAPVDVVWRLVSTPDGLNEWMSVEAVVDLEVGGAIRWVHDGGWVVAGTVREVVPMRRFSFTYGWEQGGFPVPLESSVVTIDLEARGALTHLVVRHDGLTPEMADQHSEGWSMFADRLVAASETVPVSMEGTPQQ